MNFLGFTFSVWTAILFGVFFFAMVLACTADRHRNESPKWGVFFVGLALIGFWQWKNDGWSFLNVFTDAQFWKSVGIYLGIGLVYSLVEFFFQVRREARIWKKGWESFKTSYRPPQTESETPGNDSSGMGASVSFGRQRQREEKPVLTMEQEFMQHAERYSRTPNNLVTVSLKNNEFTTSVNRGELTESIGCWMMFWPAYMVSLVLGDVLTEFCRRVADVFVAMTSGFVRRTFARVFTR